jgi:hypothetical protein
METLSTFISCFIGQLVDEMLTSDLACQGHLYAQPPM